MQVNVTFNLRNVLDVNEKSGYVTIESSIRMIWYDTRIEPVLSSDDADYVSLNGAAMDAFWLPDVFVDQAKSLRTPSLRIKPQSLRVHPGGKMR